MLLPAPFRIAIAPLEEVSYGTVQEGFDAFYDKLSQGIVEAVCALNHYDDDNDPTFQVIDVNNVFAILWQAMLKEYDSLEKMNQYIDYLEETKRISPEVNRTVLRAWYMYGVSGGEKATQAFHRNFMMLN